MIISTLLSIKFSVEALGAFDSTCLNADVTHKFMIDKLSTQNTILSRELENQNSFYQFKSDALTFRLPNFCTILEEDDYNSFQLNKFAITKIYVSHIELLNMRRNGRETEDNKAVIETRQLIMIENLHLTIKQKN